MNIENDYKNQWISLQISFILMWILIRGSTYGNSGSGSAQNKNKFNFFWLFSVKDLMLITTFATRIRIRILKWIWIRSKCTDPTGSETLMKITIFWGFSLIYRQFHKNFPRSSAFINWTSVRFYETDCTWMIFWIKYPESNFEIKFNFSQKEK